MGLDMYLRSETRVPPDSKNRDAILKLLGAAEYADAGTGFWVEIPIGYWRKANAVHGWFVKKLARGRDSCKPINVTRGNLEALRDLCNEVLKNPAKAAELLPPQKGFFFGSTEIDDGYFEDLKLTVKICDRALKSPHEEFTYEASW